MGRVIARHLIKQARLQGSQGHSGVLTLVQCFGSAAKLNIPVHGLVVDGVYQSSEGVPVCHAVRAPTGEQLQDLLDRILTRREVVDSPRRSDRGRGDELAG